MEKVKTLLFVSLVVVAATFCGNEGSGTTNWAIQNVAVVTAANRQLIRAEVADTEEKRTLGLMNRHVLAADAGMLFVFDEEADHQFWMKNTYISLDLLFVSAEKKIVYIFENATPMSESQISAGQAIRYVLEVNGGYAATNGVAVGDAVEF